jgi:tRNA pseudouridine55 synthase
MMTGLVICNKQIGLTSRDVVNRVQRIVRPDKVGHAGTLDPLAQGVLVVCIGGATRLIEYVQRMPKRYRGTFLLGRSSPSDDTELEPTLLDNPPQPSREEIESLLPSFLGKISQRPPLYSAIKVAGQKAYDIARRGESVELAAREVEIHSLEITEYEYPRLELDITCGSGTYVRALGRDLAERLGTAAVMSGLVRTAIGDFTIEQGIPVDGLTRDRLSAALLPAERAIDGLAKVALDAAQVGEIRHGRTIPLASPEGADELAALASDGTLVGLLVPRAKGIWGPRLVIAP